MSRFGCNSERVEYEIWEENLFHIFFHIQSHSGLSKLVLFPPDARWAIRIKRFKRFKKRRVTQGSKAVSRLWNQKRLAK